MGGSMIGEKTVTEIANGVQTVLMSNLPEIQAAYASTEGPFSITIGTKVNPVPEGNRVDVTLSFVTGRVKDSVIRIVNEEQMSFPEMEKS
jgi:hypothetical protein